MLPYELGSCLPVSEICYFIWIGNRELDNIEAIGVDEIQHGKGHQEKNTSGLHTLDRFHIVAKLNDAVDQVRRAEVKRLKANGYEEILKYTKYCFLKNEENLTHKQSMKLDDILPYDLKSVSLQGKFPGILGIYLALLGKLIFKEVVR